MRGLLAFLCCVALHLPASALAWSPLRAPNPNVEKGNALMADENHVEALSAYDEAARELPAERGVQLNRGLALLAQDLTEPAKEAFTAAADPSAPQEIRADAYYDLGVAFAREGDALSEQEDFEGASAHFREAADAFKRSLRTRPGNRDAAWNLEYALKRIQEEEEKQAEQQQQEQSQEQEREQEEEQEQGQEEGQEQGEGQDQEAGQEQESDDESESGNENENEEQSESGNDRESENETGNENEREGQGEERSESSERQQQREQGLRPSEVERFLDALEENEESLPLQRARRRSAGRRSPEKDW